MEKALLGAIVITRYNNQTYRVDEIDWDKTPSDEFDGRNGEKMSYQKYYSEKYNKSIRDPKQPLIITIPKVPLLLFRLLASKSNILLRSVSRGRATLDPSTWCLSSAT